MIKVMFTVRAEATQTLKTKSSEYPLRTNDCGM